MIPIGKVPSIEFPLGAIIEDPNGKFEILYKYPKTRFGHCYKVKVLEWKITLPDRVKEHLDNPDEITMTVFEENLINIKRLQ